MADWLAPSDGHMKERDHLALRLVPVFDCLRGAGQFDLDLPFRKESAAWSESLNIPFWPASVAFFCPVAVD